MDDDVAVTLKQFDEAGVLNNRQNHAAVRLSKNISRQMNQHYQSENLQEHVAELQQFNQQLKILQDRVDTSLQKSQSLQQEIDSLSKEPGHAEQIRRLKAQQNAEKKQRKKWNDDKTHIRHSLEYQQLLELTKGHCINNSQPLTSPSKKSTCLSTTQVTVSTTSCPTHLDWL